MGEMEQYMAYLATWLQEELDYRQADGFVLGVSGGIDSAVCAKLLAQNFKDQTLACILPCDSAPQDTIDAHDVIAHCGLKHQVVDLTIMEQQLLNQSHVLDHSPLEENKINVLKGNVKARLRMTCLHMYAQALNYIVVGTDNAAEWHLGYFTKFGDGGVDIAPLLHLTKKDVYHLAQLLQVPEHIIKKSPSAGLWSGQTDEAEIGVSYEVIDRFLAGESISASEQSIINYWHQRSHHKRSMPRSPKQFTFKKI